LSARHFPIKGECRKRSFTIISLVLVFGVCSPISLFRGNILAQEKQENLTESTVADTKYGEGGTKTTVSGEKYKMHGEKWKDKAGKIKEVHGIDYEEDTEGRVQRWVFFEDFPKKVAGNFRKWKSTFTSSTGINEKGLSDEQIAELIEEVEKQFARDGTLPKTLKEIQENIQKAKAEKEKFVETKVEQPEMARIDPQLVGTWECISFKESSGSVTGGGTGFRVTFHANGIESVDYSNMKPVMSGLRDKTTYSGTATARISTSDGVAKIEKMVSAGAVMTVDSATGHFSLPKLPGLGPGGLGSTTDKNGYKCSEDTLEYQTSAARDGHANTTLKLTRVK